jgi:2-oxoglutarate dehydrogenase E1 component
MWVQEEPHNMGAWSFVAPRLKSALPDSIKLEYAGREAAASPATGSMRIHKREQAQLLNQALDEI